MTRSIEHWRALPQLRIAEAAAIAGVCPRTIEAALHQMETRTIGRIRFVTTDSFRRWIGETVEAKVRPLRFHDARHTFASWALESGKSIKWCQHALGHSSPELTLRTYAHLMPSDGNEMEFLDGIGESVDRRSQTS